MGKDTFRIKVKAYGDLDYASIKPDFIVEEVEKQLLETSFEIDESPFIENPKLGIKNELIYKVPEGKTYRNFFGCK